MYIKPLNEPITTHFIDICGDTGQESVAIKIQSLQWNRYLRAIVDTEQKQVVRYGDVIEMYPDIPECTIIRHK